MKKLWDKIGTLLFFMAWPILWFYLRYGGVRSRVLIICDDQVLLIRGWLNNNKFGLAGGGCKKGEAIETSAVREVYEETGIVIAESSLVKLGSRTHKEKGLQYKARFFLVKLSEKPELKLPWYEIIEARWVNLSEVHNFTLNPETVFALKRYQPSEQASLL